MRWPGRSSRLTPIAVLLFATHVLAGCAMIKSVWGPPATPSAAERTVRQADTLAQAGQAVAARDLYQKVLLQHPGDQASAEALYRLGLLQADPNSSLRDYRAARTNFTRLLAEHPRSRWDTEARTWLAVLTDLLAREEEARRALERSQRSEEEARRATKRSQRSEEENRRTKTNLERLKETDLNLERRR